MPPAAAIVVTREPPVSASVRASELPADCPAAAFCRHIVCPRADVSWSREATFRQFLSDCAAGSPGTRVAAPTCMTVLQWRRRPLTRPRAPRSEERRVGKECSSRWSPDHLKNKELEGKAEEDGCKE